MSVETWRLDQSQFQRSSVISLEPEEQDLTQISSNQGNKKKLDYAFRAKANLRLMIPDSASVPSIQLPFEPTYNTLQTDHLPERSTEEFLDEESLLKAMVEYDLIFRIPPVEEKSVEVIIESVEDAKLRFVEPEGLI